jgi:RNA polymerase sigma-70 factor (ECF subfamily)
LHPIERIERAPAAKSVVEDFEAQAVVRAVLEGDREVFRRLVERESVMVVRTCYRILGDLHEAEDAAQEAFVTAYRSLGSWRGEGTFGAWIARIAVRIALRQAARRRPVVRIDAPTPERADGRPERFPAGVASADRPATDPAIAAVVGERDAELRAAVAGLDEPYREVVALRFFGERSLAEIAEASGRPIGTIKTHLHRGLQRLRLALDVDGAQ